MNHQSEIEDQLLKSNFVAEEFLEKIPFYPSISGA